LFKGVWDLALLSIIYNELFVTAASETPLEVAVTLHYCHAAVSSRENQACTCHSLTASHTTISLWRRIVPKYWIWQQDAGVNNLD